MELTEKGLLRGKFDEPTPVCIFGMFNRDKDGKISYGPGGEPQVDMEMVQYVCLNKLSKKIQMEVRAELKILRTVGHKDINELRDKGLIKAEKYEVSIKKAMAALARVQRKRKSSA